MNTRPRTARTSRQASLTAAGAAAILLLGCAASNPRRDANDSQRCQWWHPNFPTCLQTAPPIRMDHANTFYPRMNRRFELEILTIDFGPDWNPPEQPRARLGLQLADYGVRFSSLDPGGVTWTGSQYPRPGSEDHTYRYAFNFGDGGGGPRPRKPILIEFHPPAKVVSVRAFDGGGDRDTVTLKAYDYAADLVDEATITATMSPPGQTITVSALTISSVIIECPDPSPVFLDDLVITRYVFPMRQRDNLLPPGPMVARPAPHPPRAVPPPPPRQQ